MIKRVFKFLTIRHRAQKFGEKIRSKFPDFPLQSVWDSPDWINTARTLVRLERIKHGQNPFVDPLHGGWGWWHGIFYTQFALERFGNIKSNN